MFDKPNYLIFLIQYKMLNNENYKSTLATQPSVSINIRNLDTFCSSHKESWSSENFLQISIHNLSRTLTLRKENDYLLFF